MAKTEGASDADVEAIIKTVQVGKNDTYSLQKTDSGIDAEHNRGFNAEHNA